jgi:NAD(P)-dependent dehydrogenase (short-subunit alcohol dehydrogenase family)
VNVGDQREDKIMATTRLDGRVAIVTGAGAGLGREHALLLSAQGAKVVVNDLGGAVDGRGGDPSIAEKVVEAIKAKGGAAVASHDDVTDPAAAQRMVETAMKAFGRLDILVNNAGILRDKSFAKTDLADFNAVLQVHLMGTVHSTLAAWPIMTQQKYGRIVVTTSVAGSNGNFGQTAYGAAKMAVLGLMNCLAIEGRKNNILVNALSPGATTRMTLPLIPPELARHLGPDLVSPAVGWLCSEKCQDTATIITASGGGFARMQFFETKGVQFDPTKPVTVDMFDRAYAALADLSTATPSPLGMLGNADQRLKALGLL